MNDEHISAFRPVPRTGVIFVTTEAMKVGFHPGDPEWCNLGQGQPETGPLPGAPAAGAARSASTPTTRSTRPSRASGSCARRSPALYNRLYRRGLPSQYSAENVSVSGGGRASLTRAAASLGQRQPRPLPARLHRLRGAARHLQGLHRHPDPARGRARLRLHRRRSAPRDPGPRAGGAAAVEPVQPDRQAGAAATSSAAGSSSARELDCTLLLDEFYSHYIWTAPLGQPCRSVSAARYVEDVDRDPVVIFDGLTKNWRYPGWRVTWTVGAQVA